MAHTSMAHTHTKRHKCDQTHFSVANFYLDDSDDIRDQEYDLKFKKSPRFLSMQNDRRND